MRKKNSNSSVPSGMHSLAQRSQQERRQKMEQQRARTVPQEPMRVPPQQPAHFGRQPCSKYRHRRFKSQPRQFLEKPCRKFSSRQPSSRRNPLFTIGFLRIFP